MITSLFGYVYQALSASFGFVISLFDGVGIAWVGAVSSMVLVSVILRLYSAEFIGTAIRDADYSYPERRKLADSLPDEGALFGSKPGRISGTSGRNRLSSGD